MSDRPLRARNGHRGHRGAAPKRTYGSHVVRQLDAARNFRTGFPGRRKCLIDRGRRLFRKSWVSALFATEKTLTQQQVVTQWLVVLLQACGVKVSRHPLNRDERTLNMFVEVGSNANLLSYLSSKQAEALFPKTVSLPCAMRATEGRLELCLDNVTWLDCSSLTISKSQHIANAASSKTDQVVGLFNLTVELEDTVTARLLISVLHMLMKSSLTHVCSCNDKEGEDVKILSGCYACSETKKCYRQCWNAAGQWYWQYDHVCC